MNRRPIAVLACSVFESEIALHARGAEHILETRLVEMGLHDRPDELRRRLQAHVDELDARDDIEAIAMAYGLCGLGTAGLRAGRHALVFPRAHDCITLFMGSREAYIEQRRRQPGCYYYTPGWNRNRRVPGPELIEALREQYALSREPGEIDYLLEAQMEQWAACDTALYLDLGTDDAEAECDYARRCAEWLGWRFERRRGDPALLRDLIGGNWDDERFLVVRPGMRLGHDPGERIMRAEKDA